MGFVQHKNGSVLGYDGTFLMKLAENAVILTDDINKARVYYDDSRAVEDLNELRGIDECKNFVVIFVSLTVETSIKRGY